ncbi:hypothetical protein GCM10010207_74620 [Streptomyces atratus]|nr:hypothetical protein GCM10010207_74620 [Streptomyces atratus]
MGCARPGYWEVRYETAASRSGTSAAWQPARIVPAGSMLSGERTSPRWSLYFPVPNAGTAGVAPGMAAETCRVVEGDHRNSLVVRPPRRGLRRRVSTQPLDHHCGD